MKGLLSPVLLLAFASQILGYKILIVVPASGRSHWILSKAQADILHEHGHEVTLISGYPSKEPIYREIGLTDMVKELTATNDRLGFGLVNTSVIGILHLLTEMGEMIATSMFNNEDVKKLLNDVNEKFDLIIIEHFMNDMLIGFGVKYNCPVIASSTTSITHWIARVSGNPTQIAEIPHFLTVYPLPMNLWQRAANLAFNLIDEIVFTFMLKPSQEGLYNKFFPEEAKKISFSDLPKQVAFTFLNSHSSIGFPRPLLPNTAEVGGYHIKKAGKLPEDLQKLLDSKKEGVIFFSMGSNLKSSELSIELRTGLLKLFSTLKQTVLWKFEEDLPGKPDNVVISSWLPQASILAHPNLKAFITHGGLLSLTEASSAGIPLIVIPIFGDQYHNAAAVVGRGQGVRLDYANFTAESLTWALGEILSNPKYVQNVKTIKQQFHDRPIDPRELINFYSEHVIRTGGAPHLSQKPLCIVSRLLLDVAALFALPPLLLLILGCFVCRKLCNKTACKKKTDTDKKKKQ